MFRIDMLPAAHGDCLWLEYGNPDDPHRILIDAGPPFTSNYQVLLDRIRALSPAQRVFELFVVTHIDADHIGGAIRLLRDAEALGVTFHRIWFNGFEQLKAHPIVRTFLGAAQGEYLSLLIDDYEKRTATTVLNVGVADKWVAVGEDATASGVTMPRIDLPGGLTLTVLSPGSDELIGLATEWADVVEELGFRSDAGPLSTIRDQLEASRQLRPLLKPDTAVPVTDVTVLGDDTDDVAPLVPDTFGIDVLGSEMTLGSDTSEANGSSIALLAEHADGSALLSGDAFAPVLSRSLQALLTERGGTRLRVGAFKLPHHGSAANLSAELLQLISTKHYLISTSGAQFGHPHKNAIDAVVQHHHRSRGKPEFWFNHDTITTRPYEDLESHYPQGGVTWRT